jgi:lipid II:glycine glycyltransferase (peptidoglycan interpeptide bridge formation enzyme)
MVVMEIVSYSLDKKEEWDRFVLLNKDTWVDSQSHWFDYFSRKFKYNNYSFMVYSSKELVGVFPLFLVKSLLFGKRLVSGPVLDRGGFFGNLKDLSFIEQYLEKVGKNLGVKYIEIRCPTQNFSDYIKREEYVDFYLNLNLKIEDIWNGLNKKLRNGIRRAKKDIKIEKINSKEGLKIFYELYLRTMKDLGSPPIGYDFFQEVIKDDSFILFAKYNKKVIAGIIVTLFKKEAKYEAAVYISKYRNLQANSLLVFEAIQECKKLGFSKFVFGRTVKDSNVYIFKKRWNAIETNSTYYYKVFKGEVPSDIRDSFIAKAANIVWRHMPLFISRHLGKYFRRMLAM